MATQTQQQLKRGPARNLDLSVLVHCDCPCGIPIYVAKTQYNKSKSKRFFHNRETYFNYLRSQSYTKKIVINCSGCNIKYEIYKSEYDYNKTKKFYHNRQCFLEYGNYKDHSRFTSKYNGHYRCGSCDSYVKKTEAIMHTTKNKTRTYPTCPNPTCGKYPLQLSPRSSKNNKRFRKEMELKRI